MRPTLVREPFQRAGWIYEEKVDGWRIIAYKDRDAVRLLSRNGVDHTPSLSRHRRGNLEAAALKGRPMAPFGCLR
jgi:ATP-dependent DNA ligase